MTDPAHCPSPSDSARARRLDSSGLFWAAGSPRLIEAIHRHNERVGSRLQQLVSRFLIVYFVGILLRLFVGLFLRVRIEGKDRLRRAGRKVVFAFRHHYEWDPLLTFLSFYPEALVAPHLFPVSIAGHFWMKSRRWRVASWVTNILGLVPGDGPDCGAIARAVRLLERARALTVAIFPTGPIGRAKSWEVRPGIGYLAAMCPDVPVVPVTVLGVAELRLEDILRLRRPRLAISFGEPFTARSLAAGETAVGALVCDLVAAAWKADEARMCGGGAGPAPLRARGRIAAIPEGATR